MRPVSLAIVLSIAFTIVGGCGTPPDQSRTNQAPDTRTFLTDGAAFFSVDLNTVPWKDVRIHPTHTWQSKRSFRDSDVSVSLLRYPAGVMNPSHTHPLGHGFYVIEGTLVTNRGTFGPGSFVWFPGGDEVIEHGATAEADVVVLFIAKEPFVIDYEDERPGG